MAQDEELTRTPDTGSKWMHGGNRKIYEVEGLRKIKWEDGNWYEGIDYKNEEGDKFWRSRRSFFKDFEEQPRPQAPQQEDTKETA